MEENQSYAYFPGEAWEGRTWLEGNRLPRMHPFLPEISQASFGACDIRYLVPGGMGFDEPMEIDDHGYHFVPEKYGYNLDNYLQEFSHKSMKRLAKELANFDERGFSLRVNHLADFDHLIGMNISRYGSSSYFYDVRFSNSFADLLDLLNRNGWLRLTTVIMDNQPVAIDLGCIYNGTYTLLAGGTHQDYPGIAKVINMHHIRTACEERMRDVDFLCGAFSWKTLFHLEPRPLYRFANQASMSLKGSARPVEKESWIVSA
ncbi:MAG: GNAT family N-acetyltransferase [Candidatus Eisenbacteria bacterium]|uniref:GNAT family N-acetyltransferase n=1 Tax=Eiseniibacteriota bacterium TaxID=2212470 RepID=A0A948S2Q4_UNCEI|nr:GNAT family N-acetyltransferase [Candidatus Eisenbacteria bacterium]